MWRVCVASALVARAAAGPPASFMLISGVTSPQEMCLVGSGAAAYLDACSDSVAAMDGREIWSLTPGGALTNAGSGKCLGATVDRAAAGEVLTLAACDGLQDKWELQGNGQVKLGAGGVCLSQTGLAPQVADAAAGASVVASSTLDSGHGAVLAVDGVASSFWASKLDEPGPVILAVDLGEPAHVSALVVDFEYAPSTFSVQVSADGSRWTDVFSTDSNALQRVKVPLPGTALARGVKLVMTKPHPVHGSLGGRQLYGVRSLEVRGPAMQAVLESCAVAAKSGDARDKYFAVAVESYDAGTGAALRSELPALESADAALSAAVVELAEALPLIPSCKSGRAASLQSMSASAGLRRAAAKTGSSSELDATQKEALFQEAKLTVVAARSAMQV
ncbi:unnamed protein product [Effrenium voratum]|uniref:F5/8 type C domain-containing protein n=1 Tax=Effrenium voratum TaxID=2562239 RepID=A0AA36HLN2_9DINO|nr:unnamed protein product [Effrenium voratum]